MPLAMTVTVGVPLACWRMPAVPEAVELGELTEPEAVSGPSSATADATALVVAEPDALSTGRAEPLAVAVGAAGVPEAGLRSPAVPLAVVSGALVLPQGVPQGDPHGGPAELAQSVAISRLVQYRCRKS